MFVSDWMTQKVFTVAPEDSISDALHVMKEKGIKHLPVVKNGKLKGILSDRDIKEFSPSKATSLDMYELHYLLATTKIRDAIASIDVPTVFGQIKFSEKCRRINAPLVVTQWQKGKMEMVWPDDMKSKAMSYPRPQ